MDEKILIILLFVHQRVSTGNRNVPRYEIMKFKVEGISEENILGHLPGGCFEYIYMYIYICLPGLRSRSKRVRTPVTLVHSFSN